MHCYFPIRIYFIVGMSNYDIVTNTKCKTGINWYSYIADTDLQNIINSGAV